MWLTLLSWTITLLPNKDNSIKRAFDRPAADLVRALKNSQYNELIYEKTINHFVDKPLALIKIPFYKISGLIMQVYNN